MPEGDTIFRAATMLRKALLGRLVTRFDSVLSAVRAVDERTPVAGRRITCVEPRGKHLLMTFGGEPVADGGPGAGALVLHTHMRMTGSWHIYRPGETWRKPARLAVVVIHTDAFVVPCFSAPVVELLTERRAQHHPDLMGLGPDAITDSFDAAEACARLRHRGESEIGVALLNQRVLAGVGNVFKSEVLFLRRLSPFSLVSELSDATLGEVVDEAHRQLLANRGGGARRTMRGLDEGNRLWVYGRSGEPCRVCGETVRMRRQGLEGRSTYYCPRCQMTQK